jgi:hypothetical protein
LGNRKTRVIPVTQSGVTQSGAGEYAVFPDITQAVRKAAGASLEELTVLNEYDRYYLDRHGDRPLPVILARLKDGRYYIDPGTARIVGGYGSGDWTNRWLYHGLHSLNFPWLYKYRPLWDIVVISLLAGGCALCVTSLILAWRVLRVKFSPAR